jgi:hypothetical protein
VILNDTLPRSASLFRLFSHPTLFSPTIKVSNLVVLCAVFFVWASWFPLSSVPKGLVIYSKGGALGASLACFSCYGLRS